MEKIDVRKTTWYQLTLGIVIFAFAIYSELPWIAILGVLVFGFALFKKIFKTVHIPDKDLGPMKGNLSLYIPVAAVVLITLVVLWFIVFRG
ncbi:MAG: hypothetical protein WCI57_02690 [Candidatus Berkelbacteria bacterium]